MAELGKYVLVKIDGTVIPAQMDSQLSLTSGIIETTEISGSNRYKTYEYDEKEGDCSFSVQKSDTIEAYLFNAWNSSSKIEIWYGGIEVGDKYFYFSALITGISKSDPNSGISNISVSIKPSGVIQYLTVLPNNPTGINIEYAQDYNDEIFDDYDGTKFEIDVN